MVNPALTIYHRKKLIMKILVKLRPARQWCWWRWRWMVKQVLESTIIFCVQWSSINDFINIIKLIETSFYSGLCNKMFFSGIEVFLWMILDKKCLYSKTSGRIYAKHQHFYLIMKMFGDKENHHGLFPQTLSAKFKDKSHQHSWKRLKKGLARICALFDIFVCHSPCVM